MDFIIVYGFWKICMYLYYRFIWICMNFFMDFLGFLFDLYNIK